MFSPRSKDGSDYASFSSYERKQSNNQSIFSKKIASEIVDERTKSYTQLETFYMPYLKKIFEDNKINNPSLRSPQELLFSSRLLEMRDAEAKRRIQFLQTQNDKKDKKITQMNQKMVSLIEKLRLHDPSVALDYDIPLSSLEQSQKNIKKLETLLNVKNQQTVFRLRLKALNLLQEFDMPKQDSDAMNTLTSQAQMLQTLINKLKTKIREIKQKSKVLIDQSSNHRSGSQKLNEQIHRLSQTCQLLRSNQKRLKQRLEDIKIQWTTANQKLIQRQKDVQVLDVQTFRLKRLLDEKDSLLLKSNSLTFNKTVVADDLKRDYENQIKDQRALISSINIENSELKHQLELVQGELQEMKIKQKFKAEQHEKTNREYIRWRERCEWFEKQKEGKVGYYQERNKNLQAQLEKAKNEIAQAQSLDTMTDSKNFQLKSYYQSLSIELQFKCQQVKMLEQKCRRLQQQRRIIQHQNIQSSKYIVQDYVKKSSDQIQKRLRQKDYQMRQIIQGIKSDYDQRIEIKQQKYKNQIESLQQQLKRYREYPLIKRKSDFIPNGTIGGIDTYKLNYDKQ